MTGLMVHDALTSSRPLLDVPTCVAYTQLGLLGFFIVGFGPTQALLRDEQGTSLAVSGFHATAYALAGILAAALTPTLVRSCGRSTVMTVAMAIFCVGGLGYTMPLGPWMTVSSVLVFAFAVGMLLICLSSFLLDHQGAAGPSSMTQANALAAFTGILAPIIIGFGALTFLTWRVGIWFVLIALAFLEIFRVRYGKVFDVAVSHAEEGKRLRELPRSFWWSVVLVALFSAVEMTTMLWSADLLRVRANSSPAQAAALVSAVTIGLLVGRVVGSRLSQRYAIDSLLRVGVVVALIGFGVAWSQPNVVAVTVGLFVVGLGISLNWPLGLARATFASGNRSTQATSLVSLFGSIALAIVPFTLGATADAVGIHLAFLILPGILAVAAVVLVTHPQNRQIQVGNHMRSRHAS